MATISASWGSLSSALIETCQAQIEALARASPDEPWLAALLAEQPASRELYRDPVHGFVLLAHVEPTDLYRPPHDHGRSWVIYAVRQGASEMGTYGQMQGDAGRMKLVRRDAARVSPGQARVYLPGDIHDTLCVAGPALLFRFTAMDLKHEDLIEHRVTRYVQRDGEWTVDEL
ncbi:MAG: hypothetical protein ACKVOL_05570 [Novosphingobium sp.]